MKTTNYSDKRFRYAVIFILLVFLILFLGCALTVKKEWGAFWCTLLSILFASILGYQYAMNCIVGSIVSALGKEIKISTKDSTVISGKIILKTKGLEIERIIIENASFKEETKESQPIFNKGDHTLLIGEYLPNKSGSC